MLEAAEQSAIQVIDKNCNNTIINIHHGDSILPQGQSSSVAAASSSAGSEQSSHTFKLANFEPFRILNNNASHKTVTLLGYFCDLSRDSYAIVVLEKTAFAEHLLRNSSLTTTANFDDKLEKSESELRTSSQEQSFFSSKSVLRTEFLNDIYGNFLCVTDPEINQLKVTIIYPATEKHIVKFETQTKHLVEETAEDYRTVTLPHLEEEQFSLEWIYNILEHRKEKERILFEDPSDETGFIILPDLKWDGKTVEQLYLIALVRKRNIKSLRDLTAAHLPLLNNIKELGTRAIAERYAIGADQLRIYIHYQPAFYHLHVHFTFLQHDPPGITTERSHLLSTVIENLKLMPDYYQKVTLPCTLKATDKLYEKFTARAAKTEEPLIKKPKLE